MLTLGAFTFMAPWALAAAAALPVVWLLLRLMPPAVRRIDFPAARLLFNLERTERTPARTPPWLVALKLWWPLTRMVRKLSTAPVAALTDARPARGAPSTWAK